VEDLGSRWKSFAHATVVLMLIAMVGCQGLSTKQSSTSTPGPNPLSISGSISPAASGSGAAVTLTGALQATTKADNSGSYSFGSLANGSYTVKASKSGVSFSPSSQQVTVNGAQVTGVNFKASTGSPNTFIISGTISPASDGSGVAVTIGGDANAVTTANSSGNYSFAGVANGSYTLTASKSGFSFTPPSSQVTVNGANVAGVNFTASTVVAKTFTLSGTISPAGNGSGAAITLNGAGEAVS
jgi:hypothetical protein